MRGIVRSITAAASAIGESARTIERAGSIIADLARLTARAASSTMLRIDPRIAAALLALKEARGTTRDALAGDTEFITPASDSAPTAIIGILS